MPQIKIFDEVPTSSMNLQKLNRILNENCLNMVSIEIQILTITPLQQPEIQQALNVDQPPDK
jgi:hypothetical protein